MLTALQLEKLCWGTTVTHIDAAFMIASLLVLVLSHPGGSWRDMLLGRLRYLRLGVGEWSKHLSHCTGLLEVLSQLSCLFRLILGCLPLLICSCIDKCTFRLLLNRFDAEILDELLHTLQPLAQLVSLRKDHFTASRL